MNDQKHFDNIVAEAKKSNPFNPTFGELPKNVVPREKDFETRKGIPFSFSGVLIAKRGT